MVAATKFLGNPAVGALVGGWKYVGCGTEIDGRALRGASYSDVNGMTIESCQAFCSSKNFPLAGLEYSQECYCDRTIQRESVLGQTGCSMSCKGNSQQMCGGSLRLSIFNNTNFVAPAPPSKVGGWTYVSCFMEPQKYRALSNPQLFAADDMTAEKCMSYCANNKYKYAGLEYGRECWCGSGIAKGVEDASSPSCAMQCNMVCGGNRKQICGGSGAISVFKLGSGKRDASSEEESMVTRAGRFMKLRRSINLPVPL